MSNEKEISLKCQREDYENIYEYQGSPITIAPATNKIKVLRPWQTRAYQQFQKEPAKDPLLIAATGAGKCFVIVPTMFDHLRRNPDAVGIIAVPQNAIKNSFKNMLWQLHSNETPEAFHAQEEHKKRIEELLNWMEQDCIGTNPGARLTVVTYQTAVAALGQIKQQNRNTRPIFFWVDEAHHICDGTKETNDQGTTQEEQDDQDIRNQLGRTINWLHSQRLLGIPHRIGRSTATFFRGDENPSIKGEKHAQTNRFELLFPEYLANLEHVRGFTYSFIQYGLEDGPTKAITTILQNEQDYQQQLQKKLETQNRKWTREAKIIWFIPKVTDRLIQWKPRNNKLTEKERQAEEIINAYKTRLQEAHPAASITQTWEEKTGCCLITAQKNQSQMEQLRLANLTGSTGLPDRMRKRFIKWLGEDDDHQNQLDGIIALDMMKEGTNWTPAQAVVMIGSRQSVTEVSQINGRGMRDHPNKLEVHFHIVLPIPKNSSETSRENHRVYCDRYLQQLMGALLAQAQVAAFAKHLQNPNQAWHNKNNKNTTKTKPNLTAFQDMFPGIADPRSELQNAIIRGWRKSNSLLLKEQYTEEQADEIQCNAIFDEIHEEIKAIDSRKPLPDYQAFRNNSWPILKQIASHAVKKEPVKYAKANNVLANLSERNFVAEDITGIANGWLSRFITNQFSSQNLSELLETIHQEPFFSYKRATDYIKTHKRQRNTHNSRQTLKTKQGYLQFRRKMREKNLPENPDVVYDLLWDSWNVFLDELPHHATKGTAIADRPQAEWNKNFQRYAQPKHPLYHSTIGSWWRTNQTLRNQQKEHIPPHQKQQMQLAGIIPCQD